MNNITDVLLLIAGLVMGSGGAILLKLGANFNAFEFSFSFFLNKIFLNPYIVCGFILYFFPAMIWVYLLNRYSISFLQPILALTYIITPILAIIFLKEHVPMIRRIGIIIIILGVFIVSKS